ncbi:hypothetical protein [Methanobrevibacter sp. UBA417]|uniref:hypothetical protein n=1 Tax=Methanobrevibacter sp. UBA417 TaxID=1915487 RepID=UPI0039B89710
MHDKVTDLKKVNENTYSSVILNLALREYGEFAADKIIDLENHNIKIIQEGEGLNSSFKIIGDKKEIQSALNYELLKDAVLLTFCPRDHEELLYTDKSLYGGYVVNFDEPTSITLNKKLHFKEITCLSFDLHALYLSINDKLIFEMSLKWLTDIEN